MKLSLDLRRRAISNMRCDPAQILARIDPGMSQRTFDIDIRATNPLNASGQGSWRKASEKRKEHRQRTLSAILDSALPPLPVLVRMVRNAPQAQDSDGLAASLKSTRDAIAGAYGIDDADKRIWFACEQERASKWSVRVIVQHCDSPVMVWHEQEMKRIRMEEAGTLPDVVSKSQQKRVKVLSDALLAREASASARLDGETQVCEPIDAINASIRTAKRGRAK